MNTHPKSQPLPKTFVTNTIYNRTFTLVIHRVVQRAFFRQTYRKKSTRRTKRLKVTYKRQSKNVQKWEFKNVQFYSLNISFKR